MSGQSAREAAWLEELHTLLTQEEKGVLEALQPLIVQTVDELEGLIEELPEASPSRDLAWEKVQPQVERLLSMLNRRVEAELGRTLAALQGPLRAHCTLLSPPSGKARSRTAGEMLRAVRADGTPLADWFRERSLSRFAKGLADAVDREVRKGWARDLAARRLAIAVGSGATAAITRAIEGITATAIWAAADLVQQETWAGRRWVWRTRRDEKVCPICKPLDGVTVDARDALPDCPAHWSCRCSCIVLTG